MSTTAKSRPYRYEPNLSRHQVRQFRGFGADVPAGVDLYGCELTTAIKEAEGWHWLEVAVAAGYVPHFEGIMQAVRATLIWRGDEGRYAFATGDNPHGWVDTTDLRELISILEMGITEMESILPANLERNFMIMSFDRETFDYFFESFDVPEEQTAWLRAQDDKAYRHLALSVAEAICAEDATLDEAIVSGVCALYRAQNEVVSFGPLMEDEKRFITLEFNRGTLLQELEAIGAPENQIAWLAEQEDEVFEHVVSWMGTHIYEGGESGPYALKANLNELFASCERAA